MSVVASTNPSIRFHSLPDVLVGHVFSFLNQPKDIACSRRTCKLFKEYYPKSVHLDFRDMSFGIASRVIDQYNTHSDILSIDTSGKRWTFWLKRGDSWV